jgi:NAD+ diphosphatase
MTHHHAQKPADLFQFCPRCGAETLDKISSKELRCTSCQWHYYFNAGTAVAGLFHRDGKLLLLVRNREPAKGTLDLPGGFLDPGEKAEEALSREVMEELGVKVSHFEYLMSSPNWYPYDGVLYSTCDLFYEAEIEHQEFDLDTDELEGYKFVPFEQVKLEELSFTSVREVVELFLAKKLQKQA